MAILPPNELTAENDRFIEVFCVHFPVHARRKSDCLQFP